MSDPIDLRDFAAELERFFASCNRLANTPCPMPEVARFARLFHDLYQWLGWLQQHPDCSLELFALLVETRDVIERTMIANHRGVDLIKMGAAQHAETN